MVLDFVGLAGSHTGKSIANCFATSVFKTHNLKDKIFGITVDNASSNDTMVDEIDNQYFGPEMQELAENFSAQSNHFRCFAHILNLAAKKALTVIAPTVALLRQLIKTLRLSPLKMDRFKSAATNVYPGATFLSPLMDNDTRWNSTCVMLRRAVEISRLINVVTDPNHEEFIDGFAGFKLFEDDWEHVKSVVRFLTLFENPTILVQVCLSVTAVWESQNTKASGREICFVEYDCTSVQSYLG